MKRVFTPLAVALFTLAGIAGLCTLFVLQRNGGHFVYTLDDPYIHMAIADNFAQYGVWGVTRYEFSSSSSSLLWTLLVAGIYQIVGNNHVTPFLLNILASGGLLAVTAAILRRQPGANHRLRWGILLGLVFVTPLPLLAFGGQEHILHTLLTLVYVYLAAGAVTDATVDDNPGRDFAFVLLSVLLTTVRYEGLFLLAVAGSLLFLRGRRRIAVAAVGAGLLPIVIYGVFSVAQGWYFLPNSVLLKGNSPEITSVLGIVDLLGFAAFKHLNDSAALMMVLFVALLLLHLHIHTYKAVWHRTSIMLAMFLSMTALHLQFAQTGWFMRYEAYLLAVGLVVCGVAAAELSGSMNWSSRFSYSVWRRHTALTMLGVFTVVVLAARVLLSFVILFVGTDNIYEQQYQMGMFVREYYQGKRIALNDIGAVNYLADVRSIDIWGLASKDVAQARRAGDYDTEWIDEFTAEHGVQIAIVYDDWFDQESIGGIPASWEKTGEWMIPNRLTSGGATVSFYAVAPGTADTLRTQLEAFTSRLPADVTVSLENMTRVGTR